MSWRGVEYDGKHPPLTTVDVFERVQRVLSDHRASGERSYRQDHYLVGSLRCGACNDRMHYTVSTGRNGREYGYFYCASRTRGRPCRQRYIPAHLIERAVEDRWEREVFDAADLELVQVDLQTQIAAREKEVTAEIRSLQEQAHRIRRERFRWADKAMEGVVPSDVAITKQQGLTQQLAKIETSLEEREPGPRKGRRVGL